MNRHKKIMLFAFAEDAAVLEPPFGLMLLAAELRKKGYAPVINHLCRGEVDAEAIVENVSDSLIVGFSLLTGSLLCVALEVSRAIRQKYGNAIPIVWGGIHVSMSPESALREPCIDFVIIGDGERAVCRLADSVSQGIDDYATIPGLGYKKNDAVVINEKEILTDIDDYGFAWDLVDVERYIGPRHGYKRGLSYYSSRGCPFACGFCYNIQFNNRRWRGRAAQFVVDDIQNLKERYDVELIHFFDDYFFANKARADAILRGIDLPWHAELRVEDITPENLDYFKQLKLAGFFFGAESGSPLVLDSINKKISVRDSLRAVALCFKENIPDVRCSFILFTPFERLADVRKTVLTITKMTRSNPTMAIGIGNYTPYPGAPLTKVMKELGWEEPVSLEAWAQYDRQLSPHMLKIHDDDYIARVLALKDSVAAVIAFYKTIEKYAFYRCFGKVVVRSLMFIFDWLFAVGMLSYPCEYFLVKLFFRKDG